MSFGSAIGAFFKNYVNFRGRARRSEFWFAYLFQAIVAAVCYVIDVIIVYSTGMPYTIFTYLWMLATMIPYLSLFIRRLHDIGRHWPNYFKMLIPVYDIIFFFQVTCRDSDRDNQWGPSPKYSRVGGGTIYSQPQSNPYGGNPYGQQPQGNPYSQPGSPYDQPQANPYDQNSYKF